MRDASNFNDGSENRDNGKCSILGCILKVKVRMKVEYKRKRKVKYDSKIF